MTMIYKSLIAALSLFLVVAIAIGFNQNDLQLSRTPSYEPIAGCKWKEKKFALAGIALLEQQCPKENPILSIEEGEGGALVATSRFDRRIFNIFKTYSKHASSTPQQIIQQWFAKLTDEQKRACFPQNADAPTTSKDRNAPTPTPHKTRLQIQIRPELLTQILQQNDGITGGPEVDFICGSVLGSELNAHPPYFEFDDRTPTKYLFVSRRGNDDGWYIDLNTILF